MESQEEDAKPMSCYCQGMCPQGMEYGTCQTRSGGKCFTSVELETGDEGTERPLLSYGCLPPNEMALFQCQSTLIAQRDRKNIKCCDEYDFCNKHLLPIVEKTNQPEIDIHSITIKLLLSSVVVCLVMFIVALIVMYIKIQKEIRKSRESKNEDAEVPAVEILVPNFDDNLNSGDDSGITADSNLELGNVVFVERTISKQINLELIIATGTFSEIWRAKWRGENVAVKVYIAQGEQNWRREIKIYQSPLLRHENILGYIAADIKAKRSNIRQMFLITEYHSQGSLRDYLENRTVTPAEALQIVKGLASALNHLHTEIIGSSKKPIIAHNNINSKNILVKKDKECCFGDFSKSLLFLTSKNHMDAPENIQNDDIRYLAPEFLSKTFNPDTIESYTMGDIYSFSLIIWEILSRCDFIPETKYQIPYDEENVDLTWENLTDIVVSRNIRPKLNEKWNENLILNLVSKVMVECWNGQPSVRLTCLRVKKNLIKIQAKV